MNRLDTYFIKNKAQNTKQCQQLLDICQNNYLEQVVTRPTHITATSESTLDLFFTPCLFKLEVGHPCSIEVCLLFI
jgi:hypothetical protein